MSNHAEDYLTTRASTMQALIAPLVPGIAIAAFASTPLWPFIDPFDFANTGGYVAAAASAAAIGVMVEQIWLKRLSMFGAFLLALYAMIQFGMMFEASRAVVKRHAEQCLALEKDMALLRPFRANSAELFEALGCTPRSRTPIQFNARPAATH